MEGIEFDEQRTSFSNRYQRSTPFFPRMVIKYSRGKITDENQANIVLICFAVLAILISIFLLTKSIRGDNSENIMEKLYPEGTSVLDKK